MAMAAETSFATEISSNLLMCSICLSQFEKPKLLSCQHSFCAECLKEWLQSPSYRRTYCLECPVCRKLTILPEGGVDSLPENYELKGLISMLKKREKQKTAKADAEKANDVNGNVRRDGKNNIYIDRSKERCSCENCLMDDSVASSSTKESISASNRCLCENCLLDDSVGSSSTKESISANNRCLCENCLLDDSVGSSSTKESRSVNDSVVFISDSDDDFPPTPTLKSYGDIKVGMKVYIFSSRGQKIFGHVKLLEECMFTGSTLTRTYAGIELPEENFNLLPAEELRQLNYAYLPYWVCKYGNCTVVRADHCVPASLVDELLSDRPT